LVVGYIPLLLLPKHYYPIMVVTLITITYNLAPEALISS